MFSGAKIVQIFRSTKCLTVFLVIILNTEARSHGDNIFKFSEDTENLKLRGSVVIKSIVNIAMPPLMMRQ